MLQKRDCPKDADMNMSDGYRIFYSRERKQQARAAVGARMYVDGIHAPPGHRHH